MIMKEPLADLVVFLASKAEGYDGGGTPQGCIKLTRSWTNPVIDEYLSQEFLQIIMTLFCFRPPMPVST